MRLLNVLSQRRLGQESHGALVAEEGVIAFCRGKRNQQCYYIFTCKIHTKPGETSNAIRFGDSLTGINKSTFRVIVRGNMLHNYTYLEYIFGVFIIYLQGGKL